MALAISTARAADILPPGHRPSPPGTHAIIGARIVAAPGQIIENGTIIIQDGLFKAVGAGLPAPAEAQVWEASGLTIYAGFIDPYLVIDERRSAISTAGTEPVSDLTQDLTAGTGFFGVPGGESDPGNSGPGHASARVAPEQRMADRYSPNAKLLEEMRELGFTTANVAPGRGVFRGSGVLVNLSPVNPNEAIVRADVFQHVAFDTDNPQRQAYPRSLMGVIAVVRQTFLDADYYKRDLEHYRQHPQRARPQFDPGLTSLAAALDQKQTVVIEPGSALMADCAARLARELGLRFCLVSCGEEWRRPDLAAATGATFIVPLAFSEVPKLPEEPDWTEISLDLLRSWDWAPENPALLRRQGLEIALTTFDLPERKQFRKNLRLAIDRGLSEHDALAALTTIPALLCGVEKQLGTIEPGKIANLTVVEGGSYFEPARKISAVWIDGRIYPVKNETRSFPRAPAASNESDEDAPPKVEPARSSPRVARPPDATRGPLETPDSVLFVGATIWTCGPAGRLENADLLVLDGKIEAVGRSLTRPEDARIVDASGQHITPGLIDAHSHSMILGGVNEGTLPSTAMVRISDVINSETVNIQRQLAGGLTVANVLHGSANPIGGQNCVIKLRDGASPEGLKFEGAPAGIKFALGENVKQSNWSADSTSRFPQTRMGVQTFLANRFTAAKQYLAERDRLDAPPRRRDLELEALAEVLRGRRWIHCHSYRQDEIIMLLRLMEQFDVTVGTLQHVLEGYKVADEIARHGAGASCFSDWWAYKFEVYDAIPHAGSLMRERGVLVSFKSDSSDLARRMNGEAAKAVKYGGTPEEEALLFVTLNPARQLRIDRRVGSLEPGKDADLVLWSGSPLNATSVCRQTWIDGKLYYERDQAHARAESLKHERDELIAKAKITLRQKPKETPETTLTPAQERFFQAALEHAYDHFDRHCIDEDHE